MENTPQMKKDFETEVSALSKKSQEILKICEKHKFYYYYVLKMLIKFETHFNDGYNHKKMIKLEEWGFYILKDWGYEISIEFVFVLPQYRRQGYLTKLINGIKKTTPQGISFTASEGNMIRAGIKMGFKLVRTACSGRELYYRFPTAEGAHEPQSQSYLYDKEHKRYSLN